MAGQSCQPGAPHELLAQLMEFLVSQSAKLENSLYDTAILQNPWAFATVVPPIPVGPVTLGALQTLGAAKLAYKNMLEVPVVVLVRLQPGGTGQKAYLQMALDEPTKASSFGQGADAAYSEVPKLAALVPPNGMLFVAGSSYTGVATDVVVLVQAIPLRGRKALTMGRL